MSDLREKVAQIVDPFALEVRTVDPKTGETLATEALLKADRIIAVCMEEAARIAETRGPDDDGIDIQVKRQVAAALRALRGDINKDNKDETP